LRDLLDQGSLGTLTVFESRFERFRPQSGPPAAGGASPASKKEQWGAEPPERWGHLRRGDVEELVPSRHGAWNLFYPAFAEAVRGTGPMPVDPWDAVATAAVLDAARTSARTAQVVTPAE
jgi:predicted dehydrogenase